jgi:hypothetical protein
MDGIQRGDHANPITNIKSACHWTIIVQHLRRTTGVLDFKKVQGEKLRDTVFCISEVRASEMTMRNV